jgi:RHS repeat-associated protein
MRNQCWRTVFCSVVLLTLFWATDHRPPAAQPSDAVVGGTIAGRFSVDQSGAAVYSVPITIAPGTRGLQPQLSLGYSSHGPSGSVGVGWTLSGFSSIMRCAVRRGEANYPVAYTLNDRYCLDGSLLIAMPGQVYGADGTTYHPETRPWVRVTSKGVCGVGPCSFTVTRKTGEVLDFGGTPNARIVAIPDASNQTRLPPHAVRVWALSRETDLNDNYMDFIYAVDAPTGEYVPDKIQYTGNANPHANQRPQRVVQFAYEPSATPIVLYQGGAKVLHSKRLREITACVAEVALTSCDERGAQGFAIVNRYTLAYEMSNATGRQRLKTITRIGGDGTRLPPLTFEYQEPKVNAFGQPETWTTEFAYNAGFQGLDYQERRTADINGDGRFDLIGFQDTSTKFALSNGKGFDEAISQPIFSREQGYSSITRYPRLMADVNGDGRSDIIGFGNTQVQVSVSLGEHFATPAKWSGEMTWGNGGWEATTTIRSAADINGDGRSDIIGFGNSTVLFQLSTGTGFAPVQKINRSFTKAGGGYQTVQGNPRFMADVNGDGRADIVGFKRKGEVEVGLSTGKSFTAPELWTSAFEAGSSAGWVYGRNPRYVMDVNGDGLADLIGFRDTAVVVAFSTGQSFTAPQEWTTEFTFNKGGWDDTKGAFRTLGDVNGDRLPDIIAFGNTSVKFGISTGKAFDVNRFKPIPQAFGYTSIARNPKYPADTVGSGIVSLIGLGDRNCIVAQPPTPKADLLVKVTNGLGGTTEVEYQSIANTDIYTPAAQAASYPYRTTTIPMDVVSRHSLGDGRGNVYHYDHRYAGVMTDVKERGFLGFAQVTLINRQYNMSASQPGLATTSDYHLIFPRKGALKAMEMHRISDQRLVGGQHLAYATPEVYPGVFDLQRTSEKTQHFSLASSEQYETELTYQYDAFGNLLVVTDKGTLRDQQDDAATCTNYLNDQTAWRLGYPRQSMQAAQCSVSGNTCTCTNPLHEARWTYTPDGRYDIAATQHWDDTQQGWLGQLYAYDGFGNRTKVEKAYWTDAQAATQPTVFSRVDITFDGVFHTFPIKQTNPYFSTQQTFDARFGAVTQSIDPNGVVIDTQFDALGRLAHVTGPAPGGRRVVLQKNSITTTAGVTQREVLRLIRWDGTTAWKRDLVDGFGRTYRHERQAEAGCMLVEDIDYEAIKRIKRQSLLHYDNDRAGTACAKQETPQWIEHVYDALGRLKQQRRPDGTVTQYDTETKAFGTAAARSTTSYLNAYRKPLRRTYPTPSGTSGTPAANFQYDVLQRLVKLNGPGGITSEYTYDSLGRDRTVISDSRGKVDFAYNRQGRLERRTDADGRRMAWTAYDKIGRILSTTATDTSGGKDTVTYTYDESTRAYGMGRLTGVANTAEALRHTYDYDPYGNRQKSQLSIDNLDFAILIEYDPLHRNVWLSYPDGAGQKKAYSIEGFLTQVSVCSTAAACAQQRFKTYATFSDYTALGKPQTVAYLSGEATQSTYTYDMLGRLQTARTRSRSGEVLLDATYTWDALDQVTAITDVLSPQRNQSYVLGASGYLAQATIGTKTYPYRYDLAGNLTTKGDVTFTYDGVRVTSGTRNGAEVFTAAYDASGNMTQRQITDADSRVTKWLQTFDAYERLVAIDKQAPDNAGQPGTATTVGRYTYDYQGHLVRRVDAEGVTSYYVSKNFDVAKHANGAVVYTKYVDGISSAVASISTGSNTLNSLVPPARPQRWAALSTSHVRFASILPGAFVQTVVEMLQAYWVLGLLAALGLALCLRTPQTGFGRRHRVHDKVGPFVILIFVLINVPMPWRTASAADGGLQGTGIPVAGNTLFFHTNQIHSTVLVTDEAGAAKTRVDYLPYGEIDTQTSFGPNDFRAKFGGREWDTGARLYLYGARMYDPFIGRFISADDRIFGATGAGAVTLNRYAYAGNNPVTLIDPTGESAQSVIADIFLAIAAIFLPMLTVSYGAGFAGELGAYFGGAAVNHQADPARWDWKSGKTFAGLAAGFAVSEIGLAFSIAAPEAIPEAAGGVAAFLAGLGAGLIDGFGENTTYAALSGAKPEEILKQGLIGVAFAGGLAIASAVGGEIAGRIVSRWASRAVDEGVEMAEMGRSAAAASEGADEAGAPVRGTEDSEGSFSGVAGCSSFAPGTLVAAKDGPKRIEDIRIGDQVWAKDGETQARGLYPVIAEVQRTTEGLIRIDLDMSAILSTPEHPYWVAGVGWVRADEIKVGQELISRSGKRHTVSGVAPLEEVTTVHNIAVDEAHSYFVGSAAVLVHNATCDHGVDLNEECEACEIERRARARQREEALRPIEDEMRVLRPPARRGPRYIVEFDEQGRGIRQRLPRVRRADPGAAGPRAAEGDPPIIIPARRRGGRYRTAHGGSAGDSTRR